MVPLEAGHGAHVVDSYEATAGEGEVGGVPEQVHTLARIAGTIFLLIRITVMVHLLTMEVRILERITIEDKLLARIIAKVHLLAGITREVRILTRPGGFTIFALPLDLVT